jgi:hypothetical protein
MLSHKYGTSYKPVVIGSDERKQNPSSVSTRVIAPRGSCVFLLRGSARRSDFVSESARKAREPDETREALYENETRSRFCFYDWFKDLRRT